VERLRTRGQLRFLIRVLSEGEGGGKEKRKGIARDCSEAERTLRPETHDTRKRRKGGKKGGKGGEKKEDVLLQ